VNRAGTEGAELAEPIALVRGAGSDGTLFSGDDVATRPPSPRGISQTSEIERFRELEEGESMGRMKDIDLDTETPPLPRGHRQKP
jgi:hypothetical protein